MTRRPTGSEWRAFLEALAKAGRDENPVAGLSAMLDLFDACGVTAAERAIITRLRLALSDLADGREVPAFLRDPGKPHGRARMPSEREVQMAYAVALLESYLRAGIDIRTAARRAATVLEGLPALRSLTGDRARAIIRWRERAAEDVGRRTTLRLAVDGMRERLAREADLDVIERKIRAAATAYGAPKPV